MSPAARRPFSSARPLPSGVGSKLVGEECRIHASEGTNSTAKKQIINSTPTSLNVFNGGHELAINARIRQRSEERKRKRGSASFFDLKSIGGGADREISVPTSAEFVRGVP